VNTTCSTAFDNYVVSSTSVGTATATTTGVIYARVRVCDDSEKTTRSDLCERYPNGNYKPIGEIQRKAAGVRLAAFGYLLDNTTSRYGGVLRAPMKYPGPNLHQHERPTPDQYLRGMGCQHGGVS
jgi:type IV pilus assembly protein PilY1